MPLVQFDALTYQVSRTTGQRDATRSTSAATQLVRFLASNPAYPELITEVIWPPHKAQGDEKVFVMIRTLRPEEAFVSKEEGESPFAVLQKTLTAFHGSLTDATGLPGDVDVWQRASLDNFLESIALHIREDEPAYDDLILMIEGEATDVERALDLALTFSPVRDPHAVQIMMTRQNGHATPIFYLRIRNLDSTYPLLTWQADACYRLFYLFCPGCFIQWGYGYPFHEIGTLHTQIAPRLNTTPVTLIALEDDHSVWYRIDDEQRFHPVTHAVDIHLNNRAAPVLLTALDQQHLQEQKFHIELSLTPSGSSDKAPSTGDTSISSGAMYHGQRLKERIRNLDMQRARIEKELNHLKDLEQSHFLCVFDENQTDTILRFVSDYPLSRLRHFLYLPCLSKQDNAMLHLLISKEGASRTDLPGEIGHHGQVFVRDRSWHAIGVDVYLPEGYAIRPFIGFENTVQLLYAFEPDINPEELTGKSFIVRQETGDEDGTIEKIVVPHDDAIELTDALRYINAAMRTKELCAIAESILTVQTEQFNQQYESAVEHLKETRDALKHQFSIYLSGMDDDLDLALTELEYRKNEMDEYAETRKAMSQYCQDVRDLIQHPGNVLFDFLRKETELHRTLANQIGSVDYRFNIQYESFEHQIKQILHRDHDTLKQRLSELLLKIERDEDILHQHTEAIRNEMNRYRNIPEQLKHSFDELKQLQSAVREYVTATKQTMI